MDGRVVHYAAVGHRGLSFECYLGELRAWLNDCKEIREETVDGFGHKNVTTRTEMGPAKQPKRSTDLRRITCYTCCKEIVKLMKEKMS